MECRQKTTERGKGRSFQVSSVRSQGDEEGRKKSWGRKTRLKGKLREQGMPAGRNSVSRRKDWFSMSVKT